MINKEDAFMAVVWDEDEKPKDRSERLVVAELENGGCIAVLRDMTKEQFLNHDASSVSYDGWKHHERIPEPKKRLMTYEEVLGFVAWNPHIVVRFMGGISSYPNIISGTLNGMSDYEWAPITEAGEIGEWKRFEVEEE